jgi:ABC-type glycerol-3-phosphate transport system substrate-binding protein
MQRVNPPIRPEPRSKSAVKFEVGSVLVASFLLLIVAMRPLGIEIGFLPQEPLTLWVLEGPESMPLLRAISSLDDPPVRVLRFSYEELQDCVMGAFGVSPKKPFCPDDRDYFDVLLADDPWLPAISPGLKRLNPPKDPAGYFAGLLRVSAAADAPGQYIGYPWVGNAQILCYNATLYPKHTFRTWEDVAAAVRSFPQGHASAVALRALTNHAIVTDFIPILWAVSANSLPLHPSAGAFLGDKPGEAARILLELGTRAPTGYMYFDDSDVGEFLWQGRAGLGVVWSAWAMQMARQHQFGAKSAFTDLRFLPMPDDRTEMGVWYLTVRAASKRSDRASTLVEKLSEPEVLKAAALGGNPPVRRDVLADAAFRKRYPFFEALQKSIEAARPRPRIASWLQIETELATALVRIHLENHRTDAIMKQAEQNIQKIVEEERKRSAAVGARLRQLRGAGSLNRPQ